MTKKPNKCQVSSIPQPCNHNPLTSTTAKGQRKGPPQPLPSNCPNPVDRCLLPDGHEGAAPPRNAAHDQPSHCFSLSFTAGEFCILLLGFNLILFILFFFFLVWPQQAMLRSYSRPCWGGHARWRWRIGPNFPQEWFIPPRNTTRRSHWGVISGLDPRFRRSGSPQHCLEAPAPHFLQTCVGLQHPRNRHFFQAPTWHPTVLRLSLPF